MIENNGKFPKFFIIMQFALSILMLIGIWFSSVFVGVLYFIGLIIVVVFTILDKKYGMSLNNHRVFYSLVDLINLIAVIAIIYYEASNKSEILNIFLAILFGLIVCLLILDVFFYKDKYFVKKECLSIDLTQICSMICIFAYFYKVSEFWFAVVTSAFEIFNILIRVFFTFRQKKIINQNSFAKIKETQFENKISIEDMIQTNNDQGDME